MTYALKCRAVAGFGMMSTIKAFAKNLSGLRSLANVIRRAIGQRPIGHIEFEGEIVLDHRNPAGELSEEIGRLQFDFLVSMGLRPHHHLIDVGCGRLRAGAHFIRFLDTGRYCGFEKDRDLLSAGIAEELGPVLFDAKRPLFIVTDRFAFDCCDHAPDFVSAHSIFAHLPPESIALCLENLRDRIAPNGVFFAAFNEARASQPHPGVSLDRDERYYTRDQMEGLARSAGWNPEYIGDWSHPFGRAMMAFRLQPAT
jgi:SAM-dependent methyltransferase